MMPGRELLEYLNAQPFRPFQIRMTSGRTFDIRHPEMVKVGRSSLIVFTFVSDEPDIYDRWNTVSLMLIESVTHHEAPAA